MRKLTIATGLALSLIAGAAGATLAHQPPRDAARASSDSTGRDRRGPGDRRGPEGRGPEGALLRGITLTEAQQQRLATLRQSRATQDDGARERFRAAMTEARAAREHGDSAGAAAKLAQLRTERERQRARDVAELRGLLTDAQRTRFDANVAERRQREQSRGDRVHGRDRDGDDRGPSGR
jgi:Spy/CpxP family protein refolding chaperone